MKNAPPTGQNKPVDIARESVAGEEDPGASMDTTVTTNPASKPSGNAAAGASLCPRCGGTGRVPQGRCPDCEGSGKLEPAGSGA